MFQSTMVDNPDIAMYFDFYSIPCENIQKMNADKTGVQGVYRGLVNQPNVAIAKKNTPPIYYQSTNLYVLSSLKDSDDILMSNTLPLETDKPCLLIKTIPVVVNQLENVYLCFYLQEGSKDITEIDEVLSNAMLSTAVKTTIDVNLREHVEASLYWQSYNVKDKYGAPSFLVVFRQPYYVHNKPFTKKPKTRMGGSVTFLPSFKEGFEDDEENDTEVDSGSFGPSVAGKLFNSLPNLSDPETVMDQIKSMNPNNEGEEGGDGEVAANVKSYDAGVTGEQADDYEEKVCEYIPDKYIEEDSTIKMLETPLLNMNYQMQQNLKVTMIVLYVIFGIIFFVGCIFFIPPFWKMILDNLIVKLNTTMDKLILIKDFLSTPALILSSVVFVICLFLFVLGHVMPAMILLVMLILVWLAFYVNQKFASSSLN